VLLVDNASGDGSAEAVRESMPWVRVLALPDNIGFARAVTLGVAASSAPVVVLLNPDTVVHHGAVQELLSTLAAHPRAGLVGGRTLRPDGTVDPSSCWGRVTPWSVVCFATGLSTFAAGNRWLDPESLGRWERDTEREVGVVTGCLLAVRRETWDSLGGFDPDLWMYGEDLDLSQRAHRAGLRPRITPRAVVVHHVGASSSRRADRHVLVLRARAHVVRKHWGPVGGRLGVLALTAGVWLRAALGRVNAGRSEVWQAAWRARGDWQRGFSPAPPPASWVPAEVRWSDGAPAVPEALSADG
jgi:GT2 family glycosyltransferase